MLSAFEATARTGSVPEPAREPSLTQGTISRQVSAFEEQLEAGERQRMRLTPAGHAYVSRDRSDYPPLAAFRAWLSQQSGA